MKKTAIIVCASAIMISGAIGLSMRLTEAKEIEMEVSKPQEEIKPAEQTRSYGEGDTMPIYYDSEDILLLPIRSVAQGLGGAVKWDREARNVTVTYKGKSLVMEAGNDKAEMHGYRITMDTAPQMINGCLYAKANIISDFFSTEVQWDSSKRQISLKSKVGTTPIIGSDFLHGDMGEKKYDIEIPVIMGLNDVIYEKGLNKEIMQEMQEKADGFLHTEGTGGFTLRLKKSFQSDAFLSFYWEGSAGDEFACAAINIDLKEQKRKILSDMLTEQGIKTLNEQISYSEASIFYFTEKRELNVTNMTEDSLKTVIFAVEGDALKNQWQPNYKNLFFGAK